MAVCPLGHDSASTDYCEVCGRPIGAAAPPRPTVAACAVCGAPVDGRFCERCGHDSQAPARRPTGWALVATVDRAYYNAVRAVTPPQAPPPAFPDGSFERRFPLHGDVVLIGRRVPPGGVDLGGPTGDVGVSHRHARLLARTDGGWSVEDLGSMNGTHVNSLTAALAPHTVTPLRPGDDVYLGAWTRLTLTNEAGTP